MLGSAAVEETKWLSILNYTKLHNYRQCQSVEFLNVMAGGICSYHWTLNYCIIFLLLTGVGKVVLSPVYSTEDRFKRFLILAIPSFCANAHSPKLFCSPFIWLM